jgi:hypothetical protein
MVVERPPGHARGLGQFVHADGAKASFQEQALSRSTVPLDRLSNASIISLAAAAMPSFTARKSAFLAIFDGERLRCNVGMPDLATMEAPSGRC